MSVPKKKSEETKPIIEKADTSGNTMQYIDLFILDNGNLKAKLDLIIDGVIYPKGEIIKNTIWGKHDLKNSKLEPITKRKTNGTEITGFRSH